MLNGNIKIEVTGETYVDAFRHCAKNAHASLLEDMMAKIGWLRDHLVVKECLEHFRANPEQAHAHPNVVRILESTSSNLERDLPFSLPPITDEEMKELLEDPDILSLPDYFWDPQFDPQPENESNHR